VNSRHRGGFQSLLHRSTRDGLTTGSLNVPLKSNVVVLRRPRLIVGFEFRGGTDGGNLRPPYVKACAIQNIAASYELD
jgi:hypothetical protein